MSGAARARLAAVGHPRRRSRSLLIAFALVLSLFTWQLVRIQGIDASSLTAQADADRVMRTAVPAARGEILDSTGTVLARSVERLDIAGDPEAASEFRKYDDSGKTKGIAGASQEIAKVLGGDPSDIEAAYQKAASRKRRFVYLAKDVTPAQWSQIRVLGIPGMTVERRQKREYPQGTAVAPLLGWVNQAGVPGGGIEQMLDPQLKGTDGIHQIERARDGSEVATGNNLDQQPVDGRSVRLTLDNDLQWYAMNELAAQVKSAKAESGQIVISDRAGNLLAVAGYPSFDNNDMATAQASTLQSRAFTSAFEPGSTQKMVTVGAALQEKLVTPTDHFEVPSVLKRAGRDFHDSHPHGTEYLTLAGVIGQSSNMGTIMAGEKLPKEKLYGYMQKLGLGAPTGVGYPGESGGLVPKPANWKGDSWYTIMFGQGLASTPVQQVSEFQTIANGGVRSPLKLIHQTEGSDGVMRSPEDKRTDTRVFDAGVAKQLIGMMQGVVTKEGSAPKAAVDGYPVAGKTSTAQIYDPKLKRYDGVSAGFIGMAPANDPQLIISVNIQKPKSGTFGGDVAAPVFSKVMGFALQHRKIPPSKSEKLPYPMEYRPEESSSK